MSNWSNFASDVKANGSATGICRVGLILAGLNAKDRALVEEVLGNREYSHQAVTQGFKKRMPNAPAAETIRKHRGGFCACNDKNNEV